MSYEKINELYLALANTDGLDYATIDELKREIEAEYSVLQPKAKKVKDERKINILVQTDLGARLYNPIECKSSETVEMLKLKILVAAGVMVDQQRLLFGDQQLEDGQTLTSYNICNRDKIVLHVAPRGC